MKTSSVTATEANRSLSRLLRAVQNGERVEITSHGRRIAAVVPIVEDKAASREKQLAALAALQKDWAEQPHITIGPWTRDDLYDRDW